MQPPVAPVRTYPTIDGLSDETVAGLLRTTRRIALVGASTDPARASHGVMRFLLERGYDVTPVNPDHLGDTIHGRTVVATLDEAAPLDMVDIFRRSDFVAPVAGDAIRLGAKSIWMQLRVIDQDAAAKARDAGIVVVMDRCPIIEDRRMNLCLAGLPPRPRPSYAPV
jgi:predicted CoA-binding protein